MRLGADKLARTWLLLGSRFLPFADSASAELPLGRLLRLSLFQVSVGMTLALLNGTLNRVMIVELGISAWLVSTMVSLPILAAPFRALIGFRSDTHRSALGWRRVPFLWFGTLLQFGGLAIVPFALILMSGDTHGPAWLGPAAAALAFGLAGAGLHTTQTAGLALATDLAPPEARARVVSLLYVMLLLGMLASALLFGELLAEFGQLRLIQVVQGAAVAVLLLNCVALWKQEARHSAPSAGEAPRPQFRDALRALLREARARRFLLAVGLGTAGFAMQDVLLEPYGGEVLRLSVASTTLLTALLASGTLAAFALAAHLLVRGADVHRIAASGALAGAVALTAVTFAAPLASPALLRAGAFLVGFGAGLFSVGTLTAAMNLERSGRHGLALGAWGAVQATASGLGIALGGLIRDAVSPLAERGALGPALTGSAVGYGAVYQIEVVLLFASLATIGPLVRTAGEGRAAPPATLGLAEFPG
jgi:BCD family chlorophyll transporter-like MFS transporter